MLRNDINKLINDYGVKKEAIINTIGSNRVTFAKMMKDNSFNPHHRARLYLKYRGIL
jgi:hypothetical protein